MRYQWMKEGKDKVTATAIMFLLIVGRRDNFGGCSHRHRNI